MVSKRIQDMRRALFQELNALKVKGNWDHIVNQIGMFSYTGLTRMKKKKNKLFTCVALG